MAWLISLPLTVAALLFAITAQAAELKVLSGNGAKPAVVELTRRFERETGHKVTVEFAVNPEVRRRIEAGETFDAAVLNPPILDDLIGKGHIVRGTRSVIGRIGLGAAVRTGAAKPDISTVDGFKQALRSAGTIAYPGEGASGIYFVSLLDRLGMAAEIKPKLRPMPAETTVEVVAAGEVDMVVVVASRMHGVPGIDIIGQIPRELQTWIGFTAGVGSAARQPDVARAYVSYLTQPAAADVLKPIGIEPGVE